MNKPRKFARLVRTSLQIASWLINLVAVVSLLWVVWLSPLLAQRATEADRKAALEKHYDDTFWAQAKTIEEAWPEVVSRQEVPYYYKHLEDAAKLLDEVGIADHKARLKPYNKLTRKERLLLARVIPEPPDDRDVKKYLEWELLKFLKDHSYYRTYGVNVRRDMQDDTKIRKEIVETISYEYYRSHAYRKAELSSRELRLASPVSGMIISIGSDDFSPGDAYSAGLSELRTKDVMAKDSLLMRYTYSTYAERDTVHYTYFRIYGETEVIAEGLYRPRSWIFEDDQYQW